MAFFHFAFLLCFLISNVNSVCKVFDSISRVDCQHSGLNDISGARMVWLFRKYSVIDMQYNNIRCIRFASSHVLLYHNPVDCSCKFAKSVLTSCHLEQTTPTLIFSTTGSSSQIFDHTSSSMIPTSVRQKFTVTQQVLTDGHEINNISTAQSVNFNDPSTINQKDSQQETSTVTMEPIVNSSNFYQEPPLLPSYQACECASCFLNPKVYLIGLGGYICGLLTMLIFATIKLRMKGKYYFY